MCLSDQKCQINRGEKSEQSVKIINFGISAQSTDPLGASLIYASHNAVVLIFTRFRHFWSNVYHLCGHG